MEKYIKNINNIKKKTKTKSLNNNQNKGRLKMENILNEKMNNFKVVDLKPLYEKYNITAEELEKIINMILIVVNKQHLIYSLLSYIKGTRTNVEHFLLDDFKEDENLTVFINLLLQEFIVQFKNDIGENVKLEDMIVADYMIMVEKVFESHIELVREGKS
jgi:hypothetical protein